MKNIYLIKSMNIIRITKENLETEHICCAISNNKDCQVKTKKEWLAKRLEEGLVFLKGDVRGKCFIEYIPVENAWAPVEAEGYMYIDCFWVSGQYKGQGNSSLLLDECIRDSKEKGKKGLVILSAKKKMPFLSDPGYLKHKGFLIADTAEPYYVLYYLPFDDTAEKPKFKPQVKNPHIEEKGFVLYYADQCPYTAKYVPLIEAIAKDRGVAFKAVHIESTKQAQDAPAPFTSYSLFYDGNFLMNEILSEAKFIKLVEEKEEGVKR